MTAPPWSHETREAAQTERRRQLVHEAGHAIAAVRLGLTGPVEVLVAPGWAHNVRLEPRPAGTRVIGPGGWGRHWPDPAAGDAEQPANRVAMLLAGAAAEALDGYIGADPFRGSIGAPNSDVEKASAIAAASRLPAEGQAIRAGLRLATKILARSWWAVTTLAERLEANGGRLAGDELVTVWTELRDRASRTTREPDPRDVERAAAEVVAAWDGAIAAEQGAMLEVLERLTPARGRATASREKYPMVRSPGPRRSA